ncbi:MAG: O-antigen ligase domain-containing protein [Verrucomicrobia bacterium]|nr:MAG: O-antigen ligase domain-containing protein [Verrucomicrobiota bacterium]
MLKRMDAACEQMPSAIWARRLLLAAVGAITFSIALGQFFLVLACVPLAMWLIRTPQRPALPALLVPMLLFIAIAWATIGYNTLRLDLSRIGKLFWFISLPAAAWLLHDTRRTFHLLWALALGCGVLAIKTLIAVPLGAWKLLRETPDYAQNFIHALTLKGSMPDGQMLMLGLVVTLGLLLICRAERQPTNIVSVLLLLQIAAFILNLKRGSWIVALLLLVIFVLMKLTWKHTLLILLVVAGALCLPPVQSRLLALERDFDPAAGGRATMWLRIAPALIKEHPLGIGYGQLTNEKMQAIFPDVERDRNHLHNNILQVLVETGWPGLAAYLLWMGWALVAAAQRWRVAQAESESAAIAALVLLLMLIGLLANGVVEYNFGTSRLMIVAGVIMGAWPRRCAPA